MVRRGLFITAHALARYRERVEPCDDDEIARRLSSDAIVCAATFRAHLVRLSGGQRVRIEDGAIVTVLASPKKPHRRDRRPLPSLALQGAHP